MFILFIMSLFICKYLGQINIVIEFFFIFILSTYMLSYYLYLICNYVRMCLLLDVCMAYPSGMSLIYAHCIFTCGYNVYINLTVSHFPQYFRCYKCTSVYDLCLFLFYFCLDIHVYVHLYSVMVVFFFS